MTQWSTELNRPAAQASPTAREWITGFPHSEGDRWDSEAATVVVAVAGGRGARAWMRGLRASLHALIVGLRARPSIAWFPLTILLFQLTESAILVRDATRMRSTRGRRLVKREALALAALPTLRTSPHLLRTVRTSSQEAVHRTRSPLAMQPRPGDQRKSLRLSR